MRGPHLRRFVRAALLAVALAAPLGGVAVRYATAEAPVAAAVTRPAPADAAALWTQGNDAYRKGQFAEAVDRYQRALAAGGEGAEGHHNLGTAYYRLGRPGLAILHLEKALRLSPRMDDARANLAIVRRHVDLEKQSQELGLPSEGFFRRALRAVTVDETAVLFLALYYLFFAVLIARRFVAPGTARALLAIGGVALLVLTLAGGSLFAYRLYRQERGREGIVLEAKAPLMEPHGGTWKAVRQLPVGLRVRVQSQNDRWVQVRLPNGLSGYVRAGQLGTI